MHCTGGDQVTSQADHWTGLWETGRICSWFSCMVLTCPSAVVSHFPIVSLCQSCWLFLCEVLWDVPKWSTKYKLSVGECYVFQGSWMRTGGREKAGRWLGGANKETAEGRKERRGTGGKKKKRHMRIQIQEQVKSFIKSTAVCVFGELLYVLSSYGVEGRRLYEDFIIWLQWCEWYVELKKSHLFGHQWKTSSATWETVREARDDDDEQRNKELTLNSRDLY